MKLLLTKPQNSIGNYKRINQKGLAFHAEAKQKNYKEEKKLRKPYEALSST